MFLLQLTQRSHFSVYYRAYAEDGAISLENPVSSDDPYLGGIAATRVAPPHKAASVKLCLSNIHQGKRTLRLQAMELT